MVKRGTSIVARFPVHAWAGRFPFKQAMLRTRSHFLGGSRMIRARERTGIGDGTLERQEKKRILASVASVQRDNAIVHA